MVNEMKERAALEAIRAEMAELPGHLGFYYKNLVSGLTFGVGEDEIYSAASVIKFPLFLQILQMDAKGLLSLDDVITTEEDDKVPSCGALNMFTGAVTCDIRTLCRLMICISDNTATNRLIRHLSLTEVERGFAELGLEKTRIRRLLFDRVAASKGIQNTICPREIGALLEKLYHGEIVDRDTDDYALQILAEQQIGHKLDGKLCEIVPISHKTGEDEGLSNDVGIVFAPQPFIVCFTGHDTDVYRWEDLMRRGAYELYMAQMHTESDG